MTTGTILLVLCLAAPWTAPRAAEHEHPIRPVQAVLRAAPDRIVVDVESDATYWIEEVVGLHPMPPRDWPADAREKAAAYVNEHLRLSADGKRLAGRLIDASYVQRPWQVYEEGTIRLRLAYPPAADGAILSGEADFFEEYRRERLEAEEPIPPSMDFRTVLRVDSRPARRFELSPGASFSIPAADARGGPLRRIRDGAAAGARAVLGAAQGWPALAALALSIAPGAPPRRRAAALLSAAAVGALAPLPPPAQLAWSAGLAAALAAGRWAGPRAAPWLEAAALAALARTWSAEALAALPTAAPRALDQSASLAGLLAATAVLLAAAVAAVSFERRRLGRVSESRAEQLYERRRRLAATALMVVSGGGILSGAAR